MPRFPITFLRARDSQRLPDRPLNLRSLPINHFCQLTPPYSSRCISHARPTCSNDFQMRILPCIFPLFSSLSSTHTHTHKPENINTSREHGTCIRARCHGSIIRHVSNFRLSELFRPTFRSVRVDKNLPMCQAAMR